MISPLYRSAFVPHDLAEPIAGAASGPLAGLTAAVKDMYDIAGERTGGGNPDWLETHPPATKNSGAVQKILDAGATIIGKTMCDEFFSASPAPTRITARRSIRARRGGCRAARRAARRPPPRRAPAISRSAATPAARCGCRPRSTGFTACGRRSMAVSTVRRAGHGALASTCPAGSPPAPACSARSAPVLLDARRVPAKIERVFVLEDAFAQADPEVAELLRTALRIHERRSAGDGACANRAGRLRSLARGHAHRAGLRSLADLRRIRHPPEAGWGRAYASAWNFPRA